MAAIVQFSSDARQAIRETVARVRANDLTRSPQFHHTAPYQVWYFELLETLSGDQGGTGSTTPALAVRRSLWEDGRWVVDRTYGGVHSEADEFYVYDGRGVGYCGDVGAWGAAEMNPAHAVPMHNNKRLMAVVDLECPPDSGPDCSEFS